MYRIFATIVVGTSFHSLPAVAAPPTAPAVDTVDGIPVKTDTALEIELALGQAQPIAGENFAITIRVRNTGQAPVTLRGFNPETAAPYAWVSINDGAFTRATRVHPGDVNVPPRPGELLMLSAGASMQCFVLFARDALVVPLQKEPSQQGAADLKLVVYPVFRVMDGDIEEIIAVASNVLSLHLEAPAPRQREALAQLSSFWDTARTDHRSAPERYVAYLRKYPDVPYSAAVRCGLLRAVENELENIEPEAFEDEGVFWGAIEFCLDQGAPFVDPLLTRAYCTFLKRAEKFALLERLARQLAARPDWDVRFHSVQAYVGLGAFDQPTDLAPDEAASWNATVRPALIDCLAHSLARGDEHVRRIAGRTFEGLSELEEWALLKRASSLVLEDKLGDARAATFLAKANNELGKSGPS